MTSPTDGCVDIRALTTADAQAVAELEQVIFPHEAWSLALIQEEITSPWAHYYGVFREGELLGYGGIKGDVDADLMTVGIRPQARGRGLGRSLTRALLQVGREAGMERVFLEVRISNRAARRLYESEGFEPVGQVKQYYRHPTEDAVVMCRAV